MTIAEWIQQHRAKYKDDERLLALKQCAQDCGVTYKAVLNKAMKYWPSNGQRYTIRKSEASSAAKPAKIVQEKHGKPGGGLSKADLMTRYDDATKARVKMREGYHSFSESDSEFLREAEFKSEYCREVNPAWFKKIAMEKEFYGKRFRIGDEILWASKTEHKSWALANIPRAREI